VDNLDKNSKTLTSPQHTRVIARNEAISR